MRGILSQPLAEVMLIQERKNIRSIRLTNCQYDVMRLISLNYEAYLNGMWFILSSEYHRQGAIRNWRNNPRWSSTKGVVSGSTASSLMHRAGLIKPAFKFNQYPHYRLTMRGHAYVQALIEREPLMIYGKGKTYGKHLPTKEG